MKKTLTALAVLGAFAGTAVAADVTLYGKVDAGLNYVDQSVDLSGIAVDHKWTHKDLVDQDTFAMKSGQNSGARFGIKGTEDLGNGMTVGFVLENGFSIDDGKLGQGDRLFGRQATLFVKGGFGEVAFGRVGGLASGLGSYSKIYNYSAFGTGWDNAATNGLFGLSRDRYDNTVTYASPEFAGATIYAQYSFQTGTEKDADKKLITGEQANSGANTRYAALGATYNLGAFSAGLVVDTIMPSNDEVNGPFNQEDSLGISLGASYDFGFMKLYGLGQYGKNENKFAGFTTSMLDGTKYDIKGATGRFNLDENRGLKGYNLQLGVSAPVAGGTVYAQVSYSDAENDGLYSLTSTQTVGDKLSADSELNAYGIAAAYEYPLSARTKVYGFAAYNKQEAEISNIHAIKSGVAVEGKAEIEKTTTTVGFGMVHSF